ncbi:MAG: PKD domain-containing protein, partial [Verrucomicrobia bacterium]|nr:PKD domain-containing protein [Verrucomicrobiota bacterium]
MRVAFLETMKPGLSEREGYELGKNIQDWMLDVSSGRMTFATTVTPTLVLPRTEAWYVARDTTGNAGDVLIDARATAKLAGFDTANYDFDAVIYSGGPGSFGGQAAVGAKDCWLKSGTSTGTACHEYGHNFGLWHANYWSTSNGSAIGGGAHIEYGDFFDTMGNAAAGDYQFNACFKNILNWLPLIHTHEVSASGTYRIHQVDQPAQDSHWRYALRLKKDSTRSYWVEYRQKFLSNIGIQNGVLLHWSGWASSAGGTHLLDATPSSSSGTNDAALMIGRTFSDYESDLHITPVAKNSTVPPSMDMVVNMGPFPGNTAPSVAVSASTLSVAALTNVTFTASVIDAQGDALSYAWDFDRDLSGIALPGITNAATATYQWNSIGLYRVRCVVSDMKGKTGSASVVVQVGNPTMYRISGTITSAGQPAADVRVSNGGSGSTYRDAVTDSDGTYTLPVYAGNYTLTALGYGYAFATTTRNVTANVSGVDFAATELPRVSLTALDPNATEGGDTAAFRITRTGNTLGPLTLRLFGTRGTAIKGTDYTFAPNTTASGSYLYVDIPSNQSQLDITVTALADALAESFETVTLELAPNITYAITGAAATVTLADTNSALPLVTLSVTDRDGIESGDVAQVVVQRVGDTASPLNVQLDITGTATNGVDYNLIPTVVTIPANASSLTLPITPIQDTQAEALETINFSISNDAAYVRPTLIASYTAAIYLFDDDAAVVTVVATDNAAAEAGNDPGVFTLSRTGDITSPLNVLYGLTGSALHGVDYGRLTGDVTFAAGSRTATVMITPVNDTMGEPAQTVVLQIRSGGTYDAGTPSNATITITDNADLPSVALDVMAAPAVEGGSAGTIRVTTTGTGAGNITVNYTLTGTATNGTDYTSLSGTLSIARNTTATLSIAPIQDSLNEGTETITLTLTPDPAYTLSVDSSVTLMLRDDELPQINISGPNNIWTESPGASIGFYISRTGSTTNALTVNCTLAGTATAGLDFTWASSSVTIPAGATGAYLSGYLLSDTLAEGTETLILNLAPGTGYSEGIASATGYIYDQDSAATSSLVGFSAATSSISEGAGTVLIPVALDAPAATAVTVAYNVNGGTATGAGIDFALSSSVLTFAPGETSKNISLVVTDDLIDEPDETLVITLTPATNAHFGISTQTVTVTDNDAPPPVTLGFAAATSSISEAGVSATVPVALSAAQASAVSVNYAVTGGSATNGTDYTVSAGTLTFAPGETTMLIPISIIDDLPLESNETILLTLSSPTVATLNANLTHTLTILDNDTVTLSIVATDASAGEPADTGTFTITRTGSTASALTINLTRSGTATNATDYSSIATTATIAATQTQTTITVTPIDDLVREGNETVVLTLASGSYVIGSPSSATVTITDDEALLSITASDANADEAGDAGAFTLSRVGPTTSSLSVNVTLSGTASSGSDYVAITVPVVIPANSATAIIDVTPVNDSTPEPSETIIATITTGPYGISGLSAATVTITDDEPFLSVTASDANARENADAGAFTITRTGSITNSLAVNVTLSGTATNGTDYTTITSPITIPALQNSIIVPLNTINDATQEGYETSTLTLNTSAAYTLTSTITASISIQDDDINNPPVITVTSPTNRNIALTNTVHGLMIEATVVDDIGPVTNAWSVVSSPAGSTVTFDNNTSPTTGARFSALGTYLLRLTASDGTLQATYDLHIAIGSPIGGAITAGDVGIFDPGSAAGSYSVNGTSITMSGSGTGLTNDATDGFYFLRQVTTSNALDVIVRVDSITGGANGNGRAGIMFRDGTGSGDFSAFIGLTNNGRLYWHTRLSPNQNATIVSTNSISAPRYLRLTRTGDTTFSAYHSADGITWSTAMTATVNTVNLMTAGLAVASANTSALTATFTNVSLPLNDNRGPVPNAGVDRSARINATVTLSGSRPDDAKPLVPGFVSSQWVKMSGPGTATVADPGSASTTATFNLPGSYTMRLVANDGEVKTYDEMVATITQDILNLSIIPGNPTPNEVGNAALYVEITRTAPTVNVFVPITLTGTATAEVDYEWPTTRQFFLQLSTAAYGSWDMYTDNLVEGTETATLTMLPGPEYTLGPNSSITWDILDAPVVTLTATAPLARENGPVSGTVTFTRNGPTTDPLTIALSTSGTATSGIDYTPPPATITIPANTASTTLDITPLADFFNEPDETIIVTANGGTAAGIAGPATLTLRDSITVSVMTQSHATEAGLIPGSYT